MRAKFVNEDLSENTNKLKVYVISLGIVSPANGKTVFDYNIYDAFSKGYVSYIDAPGGGFLLFHAYADDFKIGDNIVLYGNDSNRRISSVVPLSITDQSPCIKEELIEMLKKYGIDYTPKRPFQRAGGDRFRNAPRRLGTSYSVKGIVNM